jgi:hypothetical protein
MAGGGHISPLGAYGAQPATLLVQGRRSFDTRENRGDILVSPR